MKTQRLQSVQNILSGYAFVSAATILLLLLRSNPVFPQENGRTNRITKPPDIPAVMAEIRRGQETGDASYFVRAEKWLENIPPNGAAQGHILGLRAWIALFQHEFEKAEHLAEQARRLQPLVAFHYGVLSDAALELGKYEQSLQAAQKMLNLQADQAAYSRAAHLRELHGDSTGAIELWGKAIAAGARTPESSTAWCQVELGDVYWNLGQISKAHDLYLSALKTQPGSHRALARLARIHAVKNDFETAEHHYQQAIAARPLPEYLEALGDLYLTLGREQEAENQFAQVIFSARLDALEGKPPNRELAFFYARHNRNLMEALRIAEAEIDRRKDIMTYDVLAWAYYKNGRYSEAETAINRALRLGTPYPRLYFHAGMIATALGNPVVAHKHFKTALSLNPHFDLKAAKVAKTQLLQHPHLKKGGPS